MTRRMPDAIAFTQLLEQRLTRRRFVEASAALAVTGGALMSAAHAEEALKPSALTFQPIKGSALDKVELPPGYTYDVVARWGDSLVSTTPDLDVSKLHSGILFEPGAGQRQAQQFGQNCDAIHFFPLDARNTRGILCVNNEYTDDALMFPAHPGFRGALKGEGRAFARMHSEIVAVAKAATGVSIIEIVKERGRWKLVKDSRFNRRITADTPIDIHGPARGSSLLKTRLDPQGTQAFGTFANCAGGETPWGTYLTCEENIQDYFGNLTELHARRDVDAFTLDAHTRFRMWKTYSMYGWEVADSRFDLAQEPNEPFRCGWVVEIDPRDPKRAPVKRTALGRFAHEGASPVVATNGRVAVYMGDDDKFEYVYKFVSRDKFDAKNPSASRDLLDHGTLFVARFDASGQGVWLPLVYSPKGPLNAAAGFRDQADVVIKARAAAQRLGATPMDRPEDIEANPTTGRVYIACTRNEQRTAAASSVEYAGRVVEAGSDAANPRGANPWGHIIELHEAGDDHTAREFTWEVFLLAGDPAGGKLITDVAALKAETLDPASTYYAGYSNATQLSPIGSPDNIGFDALGNLWIVTDGSQPDHSNNGCFACPTTGPDRGKLQRFMTGPIGAEICGCQFSPDGETLFLSIQHPGEGGTVDKPLSRWPDGPGTQPRASVIAIRKEGGGRVGS